VTDKNTMYED